MNPTSKNEGMVFGIHPVAEALKAGKDIDRFFVQRDLKSDELNELMHLAKEFNVPISKVPAEKLNSITRKRHQGVIAFLAAVSYASLDNIISELYAVGKQPLILVLDHLTDVRNFGAIARTAECMGVHAIVVPAKGGAQIGADALKTSAGALNRIPVCRENRLMDAIVYLRDSGLQIVGCTEKTDRLLTDVDFVMPTAIVMGSEETGISNDILRTADQLAKIPMGGKIESLNVSVAAGMILYEAVRQNMMRTLN